MQLAHIDLDNLTLSPANMRYSGKAAAPKVDDLVPSVRARGVLQTILVEPNGTPERFGVVAGWRRVCAARKVRDEGGTIGPVPCGILEAGDDASAIEASMIENLHRLNADEMTEYEGFYRLVKEGRTVPEIAATFGKTEQQVKQCLALGNLHPKIRAAYRAEEIDPETVRALTMATKKQQIAWLKMFADDDQNLPLGSSVKHWLCGNEAIPISAALFSLEDYPGKTRGDLFGEDSYFVDPDIFWQKQNEAIAAKRDAYLASGWPEVVVLDTGETFHAWEHEKRKKKDGGRVYVAVSQRGDVMFHEGYVTRKEAQRAAKKAEKETSAAAEAEKSATVQPEVTGAMQTYIDLHRHAAVRAKLADDTGVALRLMVAHAIGGSRLWSVKPEPQRSGREETDASVKASAGQIAFEERRQEALALLRLPEGCGLVAGQTASTAVIFARLRDLQHKDVMRVLAAVMADSLEAGSALVEAVGVQLNVDLHKTWTADDAFFDLLRDKAVVNAMIAETAGKSVANGNVAATGKSQKQIIRDCLAGANGREKVTGWLPRWLEFPVRSYRKTGGLQTTAHWKSVKSLFGG